jgi:hypothetical protein
MKSLYKLMVSAVGLALANLNHAQVTAPGFAYLGQIQTRTTADIVAAGLTSPFGIGGETTDRGFSTYSNWENYLEPMGATKIRIQSGWGSVESVITTPPTYNFTTLDQIVNGSIAKKLKPFVFLGYGNSGYANGGTNGLGGSLPSGTGLDRFLDFVRATVTHYNSPTIRVTDWEIWNEPDGNVGALAYADLAVKTAKLIKSIQPSAKITIGSFTSNGLKSSYSSTDFVPVVLNYFDANKGATVPSSDVSVAYHPYWTNPDYDGTPNQTAAFQGFSSLVAAKSYKIRQGENGAPGAPCAGFALCGSAPWDEDSQAKYLLRRMLGDFARGIETNIFTITDLHYDGTKNVKGLLKTGVWNPGIDTPYKNGDQTVKGKKLGYSAFQNVTAIFDSRLTLVSNAGCVAPTGYTVQAYTRNDAGTVRNMLAIWRKNETLPRATTVQTLSISCTNFHFARLASSGAFVPRYADLLDGRVYSTSGIVSSNSAASNDVTLNGVPVGDYPVVIADQGIVLFTP